MAKFLFREINCKLNLNKNQCIVSFFFIFLNLYLYFLYFILEQKRKVFSKEFYWKVSIGRARLHNKKVL